MQEFNSQEFDQLCQAERKRIRTLQLNDQYTQTITYRDRQYRYDPDYDCFYPEYKWQELSYWDKYGWLWVTALLTVVCFYLS